MKHPKNKGAYYKAGKAMGKSRAGRAILRADRPKKSTIAATSAAGAIGGAYLFKGTGAKGMASGAALGATVVGVQHFANRIDPRIKTAQLGAHANQRNAKTGIRSSATAPTKSHNRVGRKA